MTRRERDHHREAVWQAAKRAVHAYIREPTARQGEEMEAAWRKVRELDDYSRPGANDTAEA